MLLLGVNLGLFGATCLVIWIAGTKLTRAAEELSRRWPISREAMGFLFLALVTQLPEIVTNSTGAVRGAGRLVVNSMFGGVLMQTAVLAGADLAVRRQALTYVAQRSVNLLQAALLMGLLALALGISVVGDIAIIRTASGYALGAAPVLLALAYLGALRLLLSYESDSAWQVSAGRRPQAVETGDPSEKDDPSEAARRPLKHVSQAQLLVVAAIAALAIFVCGVGVVWLSQELAVQTGLGSSFVGATLLASATSLPELSTTVAAVRLRAYSMAVSDIIGSNAIMLVLLLPSDMLFRDGLLFDSIDASGQFSLAVGIVVTAIYLVGLIRRSPRKILGLGADSWLVLVSYGGALLGLYSLR